MMKKGSITVYLCLLLSVFLLVFQVIYRSVKLAGARVQLAAGVQQSLYSVFAQYDSVLLEEYDLLFLDGSFGGTKLRQDVLCDLVSEGVRAVAVPESGRRDIWGLSVGGTGLTGYTLATDRHGEAFRKQAVAAARSQLGSQGIRKLLSLVDEEEKIMEEQAAVHAGNSEEEALEAYDKEKEEAEKRQEEQGEAGELPQPPAEPVENPIEVIRKVWKMGVLGLVVKQPETVSEGTVKRAELPSGRTLNKGFGLQKLPEDTDFTEKLLFQEYLLAHLDCYTDGGKGEGMQYELEYVIRGKDKDTDNLKAVVKELLLVREAANFTYLVTDSQRRLEAAGMAAAISTSIGLPIAEGLVRKALQACWAFGESVLDVRELLDGGKVPLRKTDETWQLQLSELIHLLDGLDSFRKEQKEGLTYRDYLRLLLLVVKEEKQVERGMDMVEYGMRKREGKENFRLDCCISNLQTELTADLDGTEFRIARGYGYEEE